MAVNRLRNVAGGETRVNVETNHMDERDDSEDITDEEPGRDLDNGEGDPAPLLARAPVHEPFPLESLKRPPTPLVREPLGPAPPPVPRSPPLHESLRSPPPPFRRQSLNPRSQEVDERAPHGRRRSAGISPWLFVMATALNTTVASVLAVIITLGVVRQEHAGAEGRQDAYPLTARLPVPLREAAAVGTAFPSRSISLVPIGAPDQPLRLEPQRPTRLPLQVLPEAEANTPFIMALSGAPAGTALFGANRINADSWYVPPGALKQLQIVVPDWSASVIEITIGLRGSDSDLAAQTKAWVSVLPSAAAAPAADEANVKDLLAKADRLVAKGDIIGARAMYERTAEMGSGAGALALGATYDPNRLWSLGVLGLSGSKERAKRWYQRAIDLGNAEAKARIDALGF